MSAVNYDAVLFEAGRPTYLLLSVWRNLNPAIPLHPGLDALDAERCATPLFRGTWRAAFPDRRALPDEPLAEPDGRGTQAFWDAMR